MIKNIFSKFGFSNIKETFVGNVSKYTMTPHQYWLTQGKGSERPFTGNLWFNKEVGVYECVICETPLFQSDHKFFPPTGMASFWTFEKNSIKISDDSDDYCVDFTNVTFSNYQQEQKKQICECKNCQAHLGFVFFDGPPPTFTRLSINSGALKFVEKPWFEDPVQLKKNQKLRMQNIKEQEKINQKELKLKYNPQQYEHIIEKSSEEYKQYKSQK